MNYSKYFDLTLEVAVLVIIEEYSTKTISFLLASTWSFIL